MSHSRARRVLVHAAIFALRDLILDRSRKLACSHPPPAPRVRVATSIPTSILTTSSTPSPRTPDAALTPVRGGRTGMLTSGVIFSGEV